MRSYSAAMPTSVPEAAERSSSDLPSVEGAGGVIAAWLGEDKVVTDDTALTGDVAFTGGIISTGDASISVDGLQRILDCVDAAPPSPEPEVSCSNPRAIIADASPAVLSTGVRGSSASGSAASRLLGRLRGRPGVTVGARCSGTP